MVISRTSRVGGILSRSTALVMRSRMMRTQREIGVCRQGITPINVANIEKPLVIDPTPYVRRVVKLASDCDREGKKLIYNAFRLAWKAHLGHFRDDGVTPYIEHCVSTAEIVAKWKRPASSRASALLHDSIEDTDITKEDVAAETGQLVAELVKGVTKLKSDFFGVKKFDFASFKKWLEYGMNKELFDVIFIKLADRLHNMRTLQGVKPEKAARKAQETLDIYAMITDALGMWELRRELEDLSFAYANPEVYREIEAKRREIVAAYSGHAEEVTHRIRNNLVEHFGEEVAVEVETRHVYELHQRMQKWGITLGDLQATDIFRVSVVLQEGADCYSALGHIHRDFPRVRATQENFMYWFEDRISDPDLNGHQFLHVYVKNVPAFRILLFQIRDCEMWRNYRLGVLTRQSWEASTRFLGSLLAALSQEEINPKDLSNLYRVIGDYALQMGVFTPKGEARLLPKGSTALDFARLIHEEVFMHAVGAKINNRPASLFSEIHSGDTVEIITDKTARPSLEWLEHVRTPEARRGIREYLKKRPQRESLAEGRQALNWESEKYHFSGAELFHLKVGLQYLSDNHMNVYELLSRIGRGEIRASAVMQRIVEIYEAEKKKQYAAQGELAVHYISIGPLDDRRGILRALTAMLDSAGYDIHTVSVDHPAEGKVNITLGVRVLGGEGDGGMAGEVQRAQVNNIIEKIRGSYV